MADSPLNPATSSAAPSPTAPMLQPPRPAVRTPRDEDDGYAVFSFGQLLLVSFLGGATGLGLFAGLNQSRLHGGPGWIAGVLVGAIADMLVGCLSLVVPLSWGLLLLAWHIVIAPAGALAWQLQGPAIAAALENPHVEYATRTSVRYLGIALALGSFVLSSTAYVLVDSPGAAVHSTWRGDGYVKCGFGDEAGRAVLDLTKPLLDKSQVRQVSLDTCFSGTLRARVIAARPLSEEERVSLSRRLQGVREEFRTVTVFQCESWTNCPAESRGLWLPAVIQ